MNSKSDDTIFSCEIKYGQFDLAGKNKNKLDNLDSWAVESSDSLFARKFLISKKYIEEDLSDAYKRVYVSPNDTLEVFLFYDHYVRETKTLDAQFMVKRLTAVSLILMAVFLIFQIS